MSYPESYPSFVASDPPPFSATDAIGIWPEFDINNGEFDPNSPFEQPQPHPPFKRARHSEETQSNVVQCTPMNARMPVSLPVNKGVSNIFFKTRMCAKFRIGTCRNGENCNFAHGMEDLRQPPPNWQELVGGGREEERTNGTWDDDQKIIHRMKLCKKFYNGEECPYGDRCNFLHEDPSKFRDDSGRLRESSAISIGTTGAQMGHGSGSKQSEGSRTMNNPGSDAVRVNMKPVYWKTKLCMKYETTGHCPFGEKCHFAHGQAEMHIDNWNIGGEIANTGSSTMRTGSLQAKVHSIPPTNTAPPAIQGGLPAVNDKEQGKKCLLKWKGPKKINRIYADWLDDLPLVNNVPSQVES